MDKKFLFSCLICVFIFAFSTAFYFNDETIIKSENRMVTAFPKLPEKFSTSKIKHFFTQLSQFYNDNFPNREKIILTLTTLIPSVKTENLSIDTVISGKEDWLFLGNNYNNTIDKLTGKLYYHDSDNKKYDVTKRYDFYKNIAEKVLAHSKEVFFLIAPDKSTVYPEFLPETIIPAPKPFHEFLTQKMQRENLNVYYPRQDLLQNKEKALLYYVTDSHWNNYGAFIAFIRLISRLDPALPEMIKEEDFRFKPLKSTAGDLISLGNFLFKDKDYKDTFQVSYKNMPMETPKAEQTENKQNGLIQTVNPEALTDKTVWIIGDSFSTALRPYFSFFFKNVYFIHKDTFNASPAGFTDIQADFAVYECVERSF
ncbi:hypothetical protein JBF11_06355 [Taurinivorans muris]|uniref:AlgX/AlgJ SGNH hydrolase-like domain-containing protein n=1 Tax=Taurinivorans muris TaxID=2787751 RepID=A0ABY5XZ51_9BACT|nr:hypothetical protein JBF11_06355 [Desulfovibrionaceae bacterium LT0009]